MKKISVFDVARYISNQCGSMTAMKLQKLVYYCQAWSLVWDEEPLFEEKIEAWANGPVVRELYNHHKGYFEIKSLDVGDSRKLNEAQKETIDAVIKHYGNKSSQWLSDLTHKEEPWIIARGKLKANERGSSKISHASMAEYYSSL